MSVVPSERVGVDRESRSCDYSVFASVLEQKTGRHAGDIGGMRPQQTGTAWQPRTHATTHTPNEDDENPPDAEHCY